jgi:hypothetical protein
MIDQAYRPSGSQDSNKQSSALERSELHFRLICTVRPLWAVCGSVMSVPGLWVRYIMHISYHPSTSEVTVNGAMDE